MSSRPLAGKVALVTGAARGIGKGIALQLGEAGALVYITGRNLVTAANSSYANSLTDTANIIKERGGKCIPVKCDHSKDKDVGNLFEEIKRAQDGQLDVLVNNAYSAVPTILENDGKLFWEMSTTIWDDINTVKLRNHYLCTVYATRLMVPRETGLIVNISSIGGLKYLFNIPYGIGKEACDRMAADCAIELRKHSVAMVSLWPGAIKTETINQHVLDTSTEIKDAKDAIRRDLFEDGETPEYSGKFILLRIQI